MQLAKSASLENSVVNSVFSIIMRERMIISFIFASSLVLVLSFVRPQLVNYTRMLPNAFHSMRGHWRDCADMVITGDSRVNQGLSPEAMRKHMGNLRILNYGFNGLGYSEEYLKGIEDILDPESQRKIILLGITPRSLTARACLTNGYLDSVANKRYQQRSLPSLEPLFHFVRPYTTQEIRDLITQKELNYRVTDYHLDGWSACEQKYPTPEKVIEFLNVFDSKYKGGVSADVILRLQTKVKEWTRNGVTVYGFRPPTSSEIVRQTDERSGFRELDFVQDFKNAGGVWLEVDQDGYLTFDGLHMMRDVAVKFSDDLARQIVTLRDENGWVIARSPTSSP